MIPAKYRLLASVLAFILAVVALYWTGYRKGSEAVQARWDLAVANQTAATAKGAAKAAEVTTVEVVKYVDRIKVVRERAQAIAKETPRYVPASADAACVVPVGFVRLHDAAARSEDAGTPGSHDDEPAGIALSAVAATVTDNYGTCHLIREQLIGLQGWIRAQCDAQGGCDGR